MTARHLATSYREINNAISVIAEAKHNGWPVVPLIGGGISAEAGIPTIVDLVRYFAAFGHYVRCGFYLPEAWRETADLRKQEDHLLVNRVKQYRRSLREYVDDFNWPDPRELAQCLRRECDPRVGLDALIVDELDRLARQLYPARAHQLEGTARPAGQLRRSWLWDVVGDWEDLLRHVTDFNADYAELLFARLHRSHRPGLSHRFLALLTNILSIRLFLTVTVDPLLEVALSDEGITHRVFSLHPARRFPPASMLAADSAAVVKLHGDPSTILTGDPRTSPWQSEEIERFRDALPARALLLVLGCSGRPRVMDLIERGFLRPKGQEAREGPRSGPEIARERKVVWLHYEETLPGPVLRLLSRFPDLVDANAVVTAGVSQPGSFLRHLYGSLTTRNPASMVPYKSHSEQPVLLRRELVSLEPSGPENGGLLRLENECGNLVLFKNLGPYDASSGWSSPPLSASASERLAEWMSDQESGGELVPIWVDLECLYTLPEVVGVIIDRCRLYDPLLAPSVLSLNEPEPGAIDSSGAVDFTLDRAVDRVAEALGRGRYLIAFDSVEAFVWPQTAHHGATTKIRRDERPKTEGRIARLTRFLVKLSKCLVERKVGENVRIGVSVNVPQTRHGMEVDDILLPIVRQQVRTLEKDCDLTIVTELKSPSTGNAGLVDATTEGKYLKGILRFPEAGDGDKFFVSPAADTAALALFSLSCFRRTRSQTALRSLLGPLVPDDRSASFEALGPFGAVDKLVDWYCQKGYLIPLEGGFFWMTRRLRDSVYSENSRYTGSEIFDDLVRTGVLHNPTEVLVQLLLLTFHHDRIARHYYNETFLLSRDPHDFFEYVYHRVSSIRYLTKLDLLLNTDAVADAVAGAVAQAGRRIRKVIGLPAGEERYLSLPSKTVNKLGKPGDLKQEVWRRRVREITSLRVAWLASQEELLSQVPAEQLISWCEWLVVDDLPRFKVSYYPGRAQADSKSDLDDPVMKGISRLRDDLCDLWARCCLERTDPLASLNVRVRQLQTWAREESPAPDAYAAALAGTETPAQSGIDWNALTESLLEVELEQRESPDPGREQRRLRGRLVSFLLNVADCEIARGEDVSGFLHGLRKHLKGGDRLARLRRLYLTAQNEICAASRAAHDGRQHDLKNHLDGATKATEKGLVTVRPITRRGGPAAGRFYFQYRSLFLLAKGQAAWRRRDEDAFKRAYQDFELARGRIRQFSDRTFLARIDLATAEAALAHADWLLRPKQRSREEFDTVCDQADAKYRIVDGYLRHAFDHLLHARRNVVWWKEYARLVCEYKLHRNLLRLTQLTEMKSRAGRKVDFESTRDPRFERKFKAATRSFTRTLRQCLETVRRRLDVELSLPDDGWAAYVCTGMLLTSWRFGELALSVYRSESPASAKSLIPYWCWLLQTVGLKDRSLETLQLGNCTAVETIVSLIPTDGDPLAIRQTILKNSQRR